MTERAFCCKEAITMRNGVRIAIPTTVFVAGVLFGSCEMPDHNTSPRPQIYEVHIIHADGTGERNLGAGYSTFVLADSTMILLGQGASNLILATYDETTLTTLYPGLEWTNCSLSRDRKKVLLTRLVSGASILESYVFVMDANGANLTQLGIPAGIFSYPQLSPRSDEIVYRRIRDIFTVNVDGSNLQQIIRGNDTASCDYPLYVDQDRIVYCQDSMKARRTDLPNRSIRLYNKRTQKDTAVIDHSELFYMNWGNHLVGDTLSCNANPVRMLDLRTGASTDVPGTGTSTASLSPDGSIIVAVATGEKSLLVMDTRTRAIHTVFTVSDPKTFIMFGEISSDNRSIVFMVQVNE